VDTASPVPPTHRQGTGESVSTSCKTDSLPHKNGLFKRLPAGPHLCLARDCRDVEPASSVAHNFELELVSVEIAVACWRASEQNSAI